MTLALCNPTFPQHAHCTQGDSAFERIPAESMRDGLAQHLRRHVLLARDESQVSSSRQSVRRRAYVIWEVVVESTQDSLNSVTQRRDVACLLYLDREAIGAGMCQWEKDGI